MQLTSGRNSTYHIAEYEIAVLLQSYITNIIFALTKKQKYVTKSIQLKQSIKYANLGLYSKQAKNNSDLFFKKGETQRATSLLLLLEKSEKMKWAKIYY